MLDNLEKGSFLKLFNRGGCVLDFVKADFNAFTMESIGVALCEKYKRSKGASLNAYVYEASDRDAQKLLFDLFEYYKVYYRPEFDDACADDFFPYKHDKGYRGLYERCKAIADREAASGSALTPSADYLEAEFSSDFMTAQIEYLMKARAENPTEAIGKSKELIESCCKTILERQGQPYDKNWNVGRLSKETSKVLGISVEDVADEGPKGRIVRQILGSLQGLATGVAEFRNAYGSGHGHPAGYQELPIRHAKLAVGSSVTLVEYYWETYEWKKGQGLLR